MSNGLGFNKYTASYLTRVKDGGGTMPNASLLQTFENLASSLVGVFGIAPIAVYPFYGGTAASHSVNLFNDKYSIQWLGTVTHNSSGITGNGVDGFGDTGVFLGQLLSGAVAYSIGVYSRTESTGDDVEISASSAAGIISIQCRTAAFNTVFLTGGGNITANLGGSLGLFVLDRYTVSSTFGFRNGVTVSGTGLSSFPNNDSSVRVSLGSGVAFSDRNLAFAFAGPTLPGFATEQAALYTIVQAYQTTLGRAV